MDMKAEFKDGQCKLVITPSDDWEKQLLGAVAKGGDALEAEVSYKPEGHYSYGKCHVVSIQLVAGTLEQEGR